MYQDQWNEVKQQFKDESKKYYIQQAVYFALLIFFTVIIQHFLYSETYLKDSYLSCLRSIVFVSLFYLCFMKYSSKLFVSLVISLLTLFDESIFVFSITFDKTESWTQYLLFISLFITPIVASMLLTTSLPSHFMSLIVVLCVLALIPVISNAASTIPMAIVFCAVFRYFVYVDTENCGWYKYVSSLLLVTAQIVLCLIVCRFFPEHYQNLCRVYQTDIQLQYINPNYYQRIQNMFTYAKKDNPVLFFGFLVKASIFPRKREEKESLDFIFLAFISICVKSFVPYFVGGIFDDSDVQFFIFKVYLLLGCGLQSNYMGKKNFFLWAILTAVCSYLYLKEKILH